MRGRTIDDDGLIADDLSGAKVNSFAAWLLLHCSGVVLVEENCPGELFVSDLPRGKLSIIASM